MAPTTSRWIDRRLFDAAGDLTGVVVDVWDDEVDAQRAWLVVHLPGDRYAVVPAAGARLAGIDVVVPHDRARIEAAPRADLNVAVAAAASEELRAHYGDPLPAVAFDARFDLEEQPS